MKCYLSLSAIAAVGVTVGVHAAAQGAKLQYGHVPVGARGDDDAARQFASLHAVQRHMVDRNACRLAWEDNEEEYDDFYDYSALDAQLAQSAKGVLAAHCGVHGVNGTQDRLQVPGSVTEPGTRPSRSLNAVPLSLQPGLRWFFLQGNN